MTATSGTGDQLIVSVFESCKRPNSVTDTPLADVVARMRGPALADFTKKIRDTYRMAGGGDNGKEAIREMKTNLPSITCTGTFHRRSNDAWKAANGTVQVDLDGLNAEQRACADALLRPYTVLGFNSPSGEGLKVLMRVQGLDRPDREIYARMWQSVTTWLASHGFKNDESTKDCARLAFLCHDAEVIYQPDARAFDDAPWTARMQQRPAASSSTTSALPPFSPPLPPAIGAQIGSDGKIHDGQGRHRHLLSIAGSLRKRGMSEEAIRAALNAENLARIVPPKTDADIEAIIASIMKYPTGSAFSVPNLQPLTVKQIGTINLVRMNEGKIDVEMLKQSCAVLDAALVDPDRLMADEGIIAAAVFLGVPNAQAAIDKFLKTVFHNFPMLTEKWGILVTARRKYLMRNGITPRKLMLKGHAERLHSSLIPPQDVVAGLLPLGGVGAIVSEPGVGKSLLLTEMARCVSSGKPFGGLNTLMGRVLYACPDSPMSTERRLLTIDPTTADRIKSLDDCILPSDVGLLCEEIQAATQVGDPYKLVLIDTYDSSRMHDSEGGYSAQDAAVEAIMGRVREMCADLGVALVFAHHCTRAEGNRPRGSMVFDARVEMWGVALRVTEGVIRFQVKKNRDGEVQGNVGTWKIVPVNVGGKGVPTLVEEKATSQIACTGDDLAVLKVLAAHAKRVGAKPPTQKAMAAELDMKRTTLQRTLNELRNRGLIQTGGMELTEGGHCRLRELEGA